jgi:acyl-CoA reductase-like NAD-dependent aldehyde dehydrogenase
MAKPASAFGPKPSLLVSLTSAISAGFFGLGPLAQAGSRCFDLARTQPALGVSRAQISLRPATLARVAGALEADQASFLNILATVDNHHGAKYEIQQAIRTLRGVGVHEMAHLNRIDATGGLRNVAVFGSTNIPLYTLVLHALIPASTGAHVWFRTPAVSRETYIRLFDRLKATLPDLDLSRIHLLTEPADVQYDNFRKKHVLGMNRKGTRFESGPADVVLFTGNPRTGDEIKAKIEQKLTEHQADLKQLPTFRGQLFLKFGAGLNPVVVTGVGRQHIRPAVEAAIEAIRINSSQDCIAPKFYVIHESVRDEFMSELRNRIKGLQFGDRRDENADYGALTFAENLDGLIAFRDRWRQNLVDTSATIDPGTRRVDPHLFSFSFDDFKTVELTDHYAPFLVVFSYRSHEQLEVLANDPRIRERAMFASVFGDSSNKDMVYIRKLFEDNFHTTILNQSIFVEESGNFPFGGYSASASEETLWSVQPNGIRRSQSHRPLLFSKEAARVFGPKTSTEPEGLLSGGGEPSQAARARLSRLILTGAQPGSSLQRIDSSWTQFNSVQPFNRPRGLDAIRAVGREHGFWNLVSGSQPASALDRERDIVFYGPQILYTSGGRGQQSPGVVLHRSYIGQDVSVGNAAVGRINPLLGAGYLHPLLFSSRIAETIVSEGVWPGSMPRATELGQFKTAMQDGEFQRLRAELIEQLQNTRERGAVTPINQKARLLEKTEALLRRLFHLVNQEFPEGAFLKGYGEFTTGDLGNQITSFSQNERNYARQFIEWSQSPSLQGPGRVVGQPDWLRAAQNQTYQTGTKFIAQLLTDPAEILIQQRVVLRKTPLGYPVEVRVDFMDGEAVHSRARYTHEYLGADLQEAQLALNRFFSRAPEALRRLSGGADLAKLENGRWVVIEFNFGAHSGTIHPELFPIEANLWLSKLRGDKTPLIAQLDAAFRGGVSAMRAYLGRLSQEKDIWQKRDISQMSRTEVAKYFRDQMLSSWDQSPSEALAGQLRQQFQAVIDGMANPMNRELDLLLLGFDNYISDRTLRSAN